MPAQFPAPGADSEPPRTTPTGARVACFSIQAEADPGVMPRVLELFAKRGLVPRRWVSDVAGPGGGHGTSLGDRELTIDVQIAGLTPEAQGYIARCLRQVWGVGAVLTSERSEAPPP